jgi:hypothetical protein
MIAEEATGEGPAWPALGSDEQQTDSVFVLLCDPSSWPSPLIFASSARRDFICLIGNGKREVLGSNSWLQPWPRAGLF